MDLIWLNLCNKLEISENVSRSWLEKIHRKMSCESNRFYHNWDEFMLPKEEFIKNIDLINSWVLFAIFFQHFEFDVKRNCFEINCKYFGEFSKEAKLSDEILKKTFKLLGDESIEDFAGFSEDFNLLQDFNLTVLGASVEKYKKYTELLRKEYSYLDERAYKQMRLKILETFLIIPTIYSNDIFFELEERARSNIKNEIKQLKQ